MPNPKRGLSFSDAIEYTRISVVNIIGDSVNFWGKINAQLWASEHGMIALINLEVAVH